MDVSLREQVLRRVRAEIIAGQGAPGKMYSVPTLSAELGVSTTPVREALLELAQAGLIEPVRNRGFRVVEPSIEALRDLFDMRELLEVRAAEQVALKAGGKAGLREVLQGLADAVRAAVAADDLYGYLDADRSFHCAFLAAAGSPLLAEMAMGLRDKMRLHGISSHAGLERQAASAAEHDHLIALAEAGDVAGIGRLMRQHIRAWEPIFADALLKRGRAPLQVPA